MVQQDLVNCKFKLDSSQLPLLAITSPSQYNSVSVFGGFVENYIKSQFRFVLLLLLASIVAGCATTPKRSQIYVVLAPKHKPYSEFPDTKTFYNQFVDNDGNLYVAHWYKVDKKADSLYKVSNQCYGNKSDWLFERKKPIIFYIDEKHLKPTNYKRYISCISYKGFKLDKSIAFAPRDLVLQIYLTPRYRKRFHSIGNSYSIKTEGKPYLDILEIVKQCDSSLFGESKSAYNEKTFGRSISTGVKHYTDTMTQCLTSRNLIIEELDLTKET